MTHYTKFLNGPALDAQVPASLAPVPANGIMTALITVVYPGGIASASQPFTIKAPNVGPVQSKVAAAGQSVLVQTPPQAGPPSLPGLTANFVNKSGSPASVTTATYTSNPIAGIRIDVGGGVVDLQISGADASDSATVQFYYSSTISGFRESKLALRYWNGARWPSILSSGGKMPVKNRMNNLEGTVSGGRFTVLFDNTSTPKITELSGTVIALSINEAPVAQPDAATVAAGAALTIGAPDVLGNDTDLEDDLLAAVLVSEASHGQVTLQPDGSFTYTPEANYTGPDSFSYLAHDGNADSEIVTVAITVTPANTPPIIANQTGAYGTPFSCTIPANAFGAPGTSQTVSYTATGLPPGIAFNAATLTLSGTRKAAGIFLANVTATDSSAVPPWSATASFTFTVARATLIVTANHAARNYGEANPPLSGYLLGVLNNDAISATYSTSAKESSPVGTYPIIPALLDLQNKLGNYIVTTISGTLTVRNVPPVVDAGPDQEKVALDEVTFFGAFSDPSSPSHVMGWDFGDGSPAVIGTLTPTHTYAHHGTYTVTLTVTDSHLASASDTLTFKVMSAFGCASDALERVKPFVKELVRALELIEESLDPKCWADEPLFAHLDLKTGPKAFDLMQAAARELANVVQDAAKGRVIAAVGQQAADELADLLENARLVSRTLYSENEHLTAVNPKNQKAVDADLKRAKEDLDKGVAAETAKDYDKALSQYANAWDDTVRAIEEAAKPGKPRDSDNSV